MDVLERPCPHRRDSATRDDGFYIGDNGGIHTECDATRDAIKWVGTHFFACSLSWNTFCSVKLSNLACSCCFSRCIASVASSVDEANCIWLPRTPCYLVCVSRWYSLKSKPGKKDEKYRGEIEVKVTFIVQSKSDSQSSLKMSSKSGSIKHLASTVGECTSLSTHSDILRFVTHLSSGLAII